MKGGRESSPFLNRNTSCLCQNLRSTHLMMTPNAPSVTLSCALPPVSLRPVMPAGG